MKKSVKLFFLFVGLCFAVVSCSGGDDTTTGGDVGGGTGGDGGGDNTTGSLGKLEDSEFVKGGNEIVGVNGSIDNSTSMINFGSFPVWIDGSSINKKVFVVKNNTNSRVRLEIIEPAFKNSIYYVKCYDDGINCIQVSGLNNLAIYPNKEVEVTVSILNKGLDDKRTSGDKFDKIRIYSNSKEVGILNLKLNLQPLAEKYLDYSVKEPLLDFGDVVVDSKKTLYIEMQNKGDVRDMVFEVSGQTTLTSYNDPGMKIDSDNTNITTTYWIDDRYGKIDSSYLKYITGQVNTSTLDRNTGSPFYLLKVIKAGDDIPTITQCNIYNEKKCLIPIEFYPAKVGEVTGKVIINAYANSPSRHPDGGYKEYTQSFTINLKGNGVNP